MPDFPIVDAHLHLWAPDRFRMSWLDGNPLLEQRYDLAEYREHSAGVGIEAMVYLQVEVEPPYALLEAQWAAERAMEDPRISGIVPWVPVEYGERVRAFLEALLAYSPQIKGVRRIIQGKPDVAFCLRPDFVRGVQMLPEYGLSFDICIYHYQLASTIEMVRRYPVTSFILDHIGTPNIKERVLDPWREQIRELASFASVYCKVSGLATEADHEDWTLDDLAPYVAHVMDAFGEDQVCSGATGRYSCRQRRILAGSGRWTRSRRTCHWKPSGSCGPQTLAASTGSRIRGIEPL